MTWEKKLKRGKFYTRSWRQWYLQLSKTMSALKHIHCPFKRCHVFDKVAQQIMTVGSYSKEVPVGFVSVRSFEEKNQNLEYELMSERYPRQYLQAKSSHHYMAPKETATAIQMAETFLSIPESSSHPKAWQIIITLSSILFLTTKLNPQKTWNWQKAKSNFNCSSLEPQHLDSYKASTDHLFILWRGWAGNQKMPLFLRQKVKALSVILITIARCNKLDHLILKYT